MIEITSRKNPLVLEVVSLHDKKARDEKGLFFTEGEKIFTEAVSADFLPERVFVTKDFLMSHPSLLDGMSDLYLVTDEVYSKMTDERSPEGLLSVFKKREIADVKRTSSVILLEGIQDPGNLGTLMRSAIAFGVRCILTVSCADPYSPKTVRSTMGAIFKIPVYSFTDIDDAVSFAREMTPTVIAATLSSDSISLYSADTASACIMIGSEGRGLSPRAIELSDTKVIIPIENIESLNASVAGAIMMYDSMMKRRGL